MQKILQPHYIHPQNKQPYPMFKLTLNQAKQVLMRESKFVRKAMIHYRGLLKIIRDEFEEEINEGEISPVTYKANL